MVSAPNKRWVNEAIATIESESASTSEAIEKLIRMALGLQKQNKTKQHLRNAIELYLYAIEQCADQYLFLRAQAMTGLATALRSIPSDGADLLVESRSLYESALGILREYASVQDIAEAEMHLGLVLQSLVPFGKARMREVIQAYQRALRVFTGDTHPQEYAILQNNLAIAHLTLPLSDLPVGSSLFSRQDRAVQIFEQALHWITLLQHPSEYGMLQNNLGNTLQYMFDGNSTAYQQRAIAAYNEALKVRTAQTMPLEYAKIVVNKAQIMVNLWSDQPRDSALDCPTDPSTRRLTQALRDYQEAAIIFEEYGQREQVQRVEGAIAKLKTLLNPPPEHARFDRF